MRTRLTIMAIVVSAAGLAIASLAGLTLLLGWLGLAIGAAGATAVLVGYRLLVQPWQHRWGATGQEVRQAMNGELRIFPELGYVVVSLSNLDPPAASELVEFFTLRMPDQWPSCIRLAFGQEASSCCAPETEVQASVPPGPYRDDLRPAMQRSLWRHGSPALLGRGR